MKKFAILFLLSLYIVNGIEAQKKRILLTNDNGIDDKKMLFLAKALSEIAEIYIAAPAKDQSGTTHYVSQNKKLKIKKVDVADNIKAIAVDGTPAECMLFALSGWLKENKPNLVISGINGGENAGMEWVSSGTIGAARMATIFGVPSIAISGLSSKHPANTTPLAAWIKELVNAPLVQELKVGQYLTVSIPRVPFKEINGVKIAYRQFGVLNVRGDEFKYDQWRLQLKEPITETSDLKSYNDNYITVVVMRADENDFSAFEQYKNKVEAVLPKFKKD
jgi:5'-nucleotidase